MKKPRKSLEDPIVNKNMILLDLDYTYLVDSPMLQKFPLLA